MLRETLGKTARHVRHAALNGLRSIGGLNRIAKSEWRRKRLLILCYHGVSLQNEHEWRPELFVTEEFLRRRFEIIRDRGYVVLPLGEAVARLRSGTLPSRSVVITFDDGFYNFTAAAAPLLSEFDFPATVYMSTYHCINQRPILRLTLSYLLWCARFKVFDSSSFAGLKYQAELNDDVQRERLVAELLTEARNLSHDRAAQQTWLGQLAASLGIDWENILRSRILHLMTPEEVTHIASRGFDIQLHTHRHRTPRERSAFCSEVDENRRILEELSGRSAIHFCYPSGDHHPIFLPWLRDLRVETATTCETGLARAAHDPLLLPRYVDTMAQSEVMFESWLSGAAEVLSLKRA
jgi:peptidoglycan/xylan/chitin deacetylase (PgdA/CDA1 family)